MIRCINGNHVSRTNRLKGRLGTHQGRNFKFPGHCSQVSGQGPLIGHHGHGLTQEGRPLGQGIPGHQHGTGRKLQHIDRSFDQKGRTASHTRTGRYPSIQDHRLFDLGYREYFLQRGFLPHNQKRPALKNLKRSVGFNSPLDILGTSEMGFQSQGHPGQQAGLFIADGRGLSLGFNHGFQAGPFFRITDIFFCFFPDFLFMQGMGIFLVDDKKIRNQTSIDHGLAQPQDGIDENPLLSPIPGIGRVHDSGGFGLDHGHTPHTHDDVFIQKSLIEPVSHGRYRIFAGQDFLIRQAQIFRADIEEGPILTGKGGPLGVFPQGAAAQRNTSSWSRFFC